MKRVYFIKPIGMQGPIKIGCSVSPETRRSALDHWCPFPLEIIAELDGGHVLERRLHARFVSTHQRREWFEWSAELQGVIDAINAGTFDMDSLPAPRVVAHMSKGNKIPRTPQQRLQNSYSLRIAHLEGRSGYACPVGSYGIVAPGREEARAMADLYLADPVTHGNLIDAPWARRVAAAYRAKLAA